MGAALLTTREGLEASLLVGIVLAYLAKTGNRDAFRVIWAGTAAAVVVSIDCGAALFFTVGELEGRAEEIFEGVAMFSAVAVLTWMIFWMRKQAANIKKELEAKLAGAIAAGSTVGLASVVFFAVLREGWEMALSCSPSARAPRRSRRASARSSGWSSPSPSASASTWARGGSTCASSSRSPGSS